MKKALEVIGIIVVGSAILIGTFLYIARDRREEQIRDYVNEKYKDLEKVALDQLEGKNVEMPEKVVVINVYDNNFVEFATSGKEGFYYSKNNKPMANKNRDVDLLELGGNKYRWENDYNSGITNKIRKHWYYYKVTK